MAFVTTDYFHVFDFPDDIYAEAHDYRPAAAHVHQHDYYQCLIITRGSCVHKQGNARILMQPHDTFILPPGVAHEMFDASSDLRFYQIAVRETFLERYISAAGIIKFLEGLTNGDNPLLRQFQFYVTLDPESYRSISALSECMVQELSLGREADMVIVSHLLSCVLLIFRRIFLRLESAHASSDAADYCSNVIEECLRYIDSNYANPISIDELARRSALSRSTFYEHFTRVTGVSPRRYIINKRIAQSRLLLENTFLSVSEISDRVGFSDFSTFYRNFLKLCGCPPGEYRSNHNQHKTQQM